MKKLTLSILTIILIAGCSKQQDIQVETKPPVLVKVGVVTDVTTVYTEVKPAR